MPCSCRQDGNVTCLQLHNASAVSAELHLAFAAGNTKHFMDAGMVVHVIVNSISPGIAPPVAFKQLFEYRRRIEVVRKSAPRRDK